MSLWETTRKDVDGRGQTVALPLRRPPIRSTIIKQQGRGWLEREEHVQPATHRQNSLFCTVLAIVIQVDALEKHREHHRKTSPASSRGDGASLGSWHDRPTEIQCLYNLLGKVNRVKQFGVLIFEILSPRR